MPDSSFYEKKRFFHLLSLPPSLSFSPILSLSLSLSVTISYGTVFFMLLLNVESVSRLQWFLCNSLYHHCQSLTSFSVNHHIPCKSLNYFSIIHHNACKCLDFFLNQPSQSMPKLKLLLNKTRHCEVAVPLVTLICLHLFFVLNH